MLTAAYISRIDETIRLAERVLGEVDFESVAGKVHGDLRNGSQTILEKIDHLQRDGVNQSNASRHKRKLSEGINEFYEAASVALAGSVDWSTQQQIAKLQELTREAGERLDEINAIEQNAKKLENSLKEAARIGAVTERAKYFYEQAKNHKRVSYFWLGSSIIIGAVAIGFASYLTVEYATVATIDSDNVAPIEQPLWFTVQFATARLITFSILLFGLVGSFRSYRSERHNYIVNQHRYNALMTFEVFVGSAKDQNVESAVLLQTTQSIFSPQQSGFRSRGDGESPISSKHINDFFRDLTS
jgi:hypothetical protein